MPGVTCSECGHGTNISFRRGTKLASIACPACGKPALHLASKGTPNRHAGRKYENCAACGRRGLSHKHPEFEWETKFGEQGPFPAGSPACWSCEPVTTARTRHSTIHCALKERFGPRAGWADEAALEATASTPPPSCPACGHEGYDSMYGRSEPFHKTAPAFEHGSALLAVCEHCGHTIILATLEVSHA